MTFHTPLKLGTGASYAQAYDLEDLKAHEDLFFLLEPVRYEVGELGSGEVIEVPAGFLTDLASVPRFLWSIIPPFGLHAAAAVVHDYLYVNGLGYSRRDADRIFHEAMLVSEVPRFRARLMWVGVRLGGFYRWKH